MMVKNCLFFGEDGALSIAELPTFRFAYYEPLVINLVTLHPALMLEKLNSLFSNDSGEVILTHPDTLNVAFKFVNLGEIPMLPSPNVPGVNDALVLLGSKSFAESVISILAARDFLHDLDVRLESRIIDGDDKPAWVSPYATGKNARFKKSLRSIRSVNTGYRIRRGMRGK